MLKKLLTISGWTFFSRIFGFVRDFFIAYIFGSSVKSDIFFIVLRVTMFFRKFIGEGVLFAAFIPKIHEIKARSKDDKKSKNLLQTFLTDSFFVLSLILFILVALLWIFTKYALLAMSPGFGGEKLQEAVHITRITLPYLYFITISSLFWAVTNSVSRYFYYSFVPVFFNFALIGAAIVCMTLQTQSLMIFAYGLLLAGLVQFAISYYGAYKAGFRFTHIKIFQALRSSDVKTCLLAMLPIMATTGITQINTIIDSAIASYEQNAVSYIYYGERLFFLPYSLFATAISVIVLSELSRAIKSNDNAKARKLIKKSYLYSSCLLLLPAIAMVIMPNFIIWLLFERGEFTSQDTTQVAKVLRILGFGLIFAGLNRVTVSILQAKGILKKPMVNTLISTIINIAISILLFNHIGFIGIVIGTVISYIISFGLNAWVLRSK